jgi:hypothetical protein
MIRKRARRFANQRWRWLPFAVLATGIGSHEAFAESIPFRLDNKNLTEARCISCSGPWSRTTNWNKVDADTNREFYHATANLFSPFGQ